MDMGTGKTRVSIELINSTDSNYVLFLAPFSTKRNLSAEIKRWGLNISYQIVGYETLSSSDRVYLNLLNEIKGKKLFIVADESIFIKNEGSKRFIRTMELAKHSSYRLILNGTPITKSEWDLYNQMLFLSPKIIGMDRLEFLNKFFTKVEYKKKFDYPREFYELSEVNVDYLYDLIDPYIFQVEYKFDKEIYESTTIVEASKSTKNNHMYLKHALKERIFNQKWIMDVLVKMQINMFTDPDRCKIIGENLEGQQIVYCNYIEEVKVISENCDCYVITGETPEGDRQEVIKKFERDDKPLIMTFGVGSFGLNLQFCNVITFASITFNYGDMEQSKARIKRIGQKRDITYNYILSDLGLYQMIYNNLSNKQGLSDLILTKVKNGNKSWVSKL